jgi:hypothetical protein
VVALLVVGTGLGLWIVSIDADVPSSSLILPLSLGGVIGFLGGIVAYVWGRRRLAGGRSIPRAATGATAVLYAGALACSVRPLVVCSPGVWGFCLALPAIIIFLVHVWPRRGEPYP